MRTSDQRNGLIGIVRLIAIGLFAIIIAETCIAAATELLPESPIFHVLEEKRRAASADEGYSVLFFGDSAALHGLVPSAFTQRTGLSSYNFATFAGASGFTNIWLLREYLAHHDARPQFLVLIVNVQYLSVTPSVAMFHRYFESPDLHKELLGTDPTYGRDPRRLLEAILPSYWNREKISNGIGMLARGEKTRELHKGYLPTYTNMDDSAARLEQFTKFIANDGLTVRGEQAIFLQDFCELAHENGIPVYVKIGPLADTIMQDESAIAFAKGTIQNVLDILKEWPNCIVDTTIETYDIAAMENTTHTNSTGALVLTHSIIDELETLSTAGAAGIRP